MDRRSFLHGTAALGVALAAAPAIAQSRTKVKLGYLHTLAVDGQIWLGIDRGDSRSRASSSSCANSRPASSFSRR